MAILTLSVPKFTDDDLNDEKQRRRIMNYLIRLDEQLRFVLSNLDSDNFTDGFKAEIIDVASGDRTADVTIKALESEIGRLRTQITQAYDRIELKADAEELDELGKTVALHTSQITQTSTLVQVFVAQYEADLKEIALEIADVSRVLGKGYWVIGTYELSGIGRGSGERIGWEAAVTPTADKNIGQRIRFYDADGGITYEQSGMRLCKKDEAAQLSHAVTIPEGAVSFDIALYDMSDETSGTDAAVRCTENRIVRWGAYVSQSVFRQEADSIMLAVNGKLGADENSAGVEAGTAVRITKDEFRVSSPNTVIAIPTEDGDEVVAQFGEDGLTAEAIVCPNVAPRYDGPADLYINPGATEAQVKSGQYFRGLKDAVSILNGRWLDGRVTVHIAPYANSYGELRIKGIQGGGEVVLQCDLESNTFKHYGHVFIEGCTVPIVLLRGLILPANEDQAAVDVSGAQVQLDHCELSSPDGIGLIVRQGANVWAAVCKITGSYQAAQVILGGIGTFVDTTGSGVLWCYQGFMTASGTVPSGGAEWICSPEPNNKDSLTPTGGSASTAPAVSEKTYGLVNSDSYRGSWNSFDDEDVRQGRAMRSDSDTNGTEIYGCMWFGSMSELRGRTIQQASLRLHRQNGYGTSGSVAVQLYGGKMDYDDRSGAPTGLEDYFYGTIGTAEPGQTVEMTIPIKAITDLASGNTNVLVLKSDDTALHGSRTFSKNYARFAGQTSGTEETKPRLTVVYG